MHLLLLLGKLVASTRSFAFLTTKKAFRFFSSLQVKLQTFSLSE